MDKNRDIIHIIENLKKQKELLNSELNLGIIDTDGAGYELEMINKKERALKEQLVLTNHVTITKNIKALLDEIKSKQDKLNIHSEYIFCHENGEWIKTDAYITFLRRLCQSKHFHVTNNHALRMSLNSNVLIPKGVSVADRAAMLGHSIETNLRHYSFAQKDYLDNVRAILDSDCEEMCENTSGTPREPHKIIQFSKKESPEHLISQAF